MNLKNALAAALNAVGNVIYYPSKWNPLVGQPKRLDELNFLEMMFIGVRRQTILKPGYATMAGAAVSAGGAGDFDDLDAAAATDHMHSHPHADMRWDEEMFDDPMPIYNTATGCFNYNHSLDPTQN